MERSWFAAHSLTDSAVTPEIRTARACYLYWSVVDCLFCRIVAGELPADIVYQDAEAIAFRDIQPQAPSHVLVLPREHVSGLDAAVSMRADALGGLFQVAARVAEQEGLADRGYRVVVNTGPDAQQSVGHLHIHVIGGRQMGWPPG